MTIEYYQFLVQISWYVFCFAIGAAIEYFNLKNDQILYRLYKKLVVIMKKWLTEFNILVSLLVILVFFGGYKEKNYNFVYLGITAILVLITYRNTQFADKLVSETYKMRKYQNQPNVYAAIAPANELNTIVEFFIQNIGLGPAYNVKFIDPPVFQYAEKKFLSDISLVKNENTFLAPNQKMQVFMMDKSDVFNFNSKVPISIKLEYKDFEGEKFPREYEIDFSLVLDVQRMKHRYTNFEVNLLNNAVELNKSLNSISSNIETVSENSIFNTGFIQSDDNELLATTENYNRRVEIAKNVVKSVLIGFCNDWKSYKDCNQFLSNPDPGHIVFISHNKRLTYHLEKFILVSRDIDVAGVLPEEVSNKLVDFASRMRVIIERADQGIGPEVWGREEPFSVVNLLDILLADIKDMYKNLDEICSDA